MAFIGEISPLAINEDKVDQSPYTFGWFKSTTISIKSTLPCMSTSLSTLDNALGGLIGMSVTKEASSRYQISVVNEKEPNESHFAP
jgi:hypothetical protein